jgi:AraC-like DNA-binding protein
MTNPESPYKAMWLFGIMSLSILMAPCLWLFARDTSDKKPKLPNSHKLMHILPILVGVVLLLPLVSSMHAGTSFEHHSDPLSARQSYFILGSMLLMTCIFFLQSSFYAFLCTQILNRRMSLNATIFANNVDSSTKVMRVLLMVVMANFLTNSLRVLYCWALDDIASVNLFFAFLQTTVVCYLCFAVIVHSAPNNIVQQNKRKEILSSTQKPKHNDISKYKKSTIDKARKEKVMSSILCLFETKKWYRHSNINLPQLCKEINDLPYAVSQAINESSYQNFFNLVNHFRIEEAKTKLVLAPKMSILEIAYSVGYNSKSTFNTAFKRHTRFTPSAYRNAKLSLVNLNPV